MNGKTDRQHKFRKAYGTSVFSSGDLKYKGNDGNSLYHMYMFTIHCHKNKFTVLSFMIKTNSSAKLHVNACTTCNDSKYMYF